MAAIPESSLPGHKQLHERVVGALESCQESQGVDFKESAPWEILRHAVARTAMAMANLRDGGTIIVGVGEREGNWTLDGVSDADQESYDEDNVNDFINRYASPSLRLELVLVDHQNVQFLAIRVPEFENIPIICKKMGPKNSGLREGAIYVRVPGKPQTTQVMKAEDVRDLVELAAEKRARSILATAKRIGLEAPQRDDEQFDIELEGL